MGEFKAELMAACQLPVISIAALANHHGVNANVLHCWLKERSGFHRSVHCPDGNCACLSIHPSELASIPFWRALSKSMVKLTLDNYALSRAS